MAKMCNLFTILVIVHLISIRSITHAASIDAICPGGHREGEEANVGSFFYECRNGKLMSKGCLSNGNRLQLGQTSDQQPIRWQCVLDSDGNLALMHKSCLDNEGRERQQNERWNDGKIVYACTRNNPHLIVESVGCVGDGSRQFNLGEKTVQSDVVYECKFNRNRVPTMKAVGCSSSGRQLATGDSIEIGQFWFYCMERDGVVTLERVGCVHNGQRLADSDRYIENDVIYECHVTKLEADIRVIGCVTKNLENGVRTERKVGCSWQEGDAPFQHTHTCQPDPAKKSAFKLAVRCNFVLPLGTYNIELGCYRVIDRVGMACMKGDGVGEIKFVPLQVDKDGNVMYPPPGFRYC